MEENNKIPAEKLGMQTNNSVCPNYGYCPCCGRPYHNYYPPYPYYPFYPTYPTYPWGTVTYQTGSANFTNASNQ